MLIKQRSTVINLSAELLFIHCQYLFVFRAFCWWQINFGTWQTRFKARSPTDSLNCESRDICTYVIGFRFRRASISQASGSPIHNPLIGTGSAAKELAIAPNGTFLVNDLGELRIYERLNLENVEKFLRWKSNRWHAHFRRQALMDVIVTAPGLIAWRMVNSQSAWRQLFGG